jgi:Uma2 family endonuclease
MATSTLPEAPATLDAPEAAQPFSLLDIRRRITVDEYHRIVESGALGEDPRVELLEGVIVQKMAKNPPHVIVQNLLQEILHALLPRGSGYCVSTGNPITIEDRDGEPEPDLMVIRGKHLDYVGKRQVPADASLVVEISNTSYNEDRTLKWSLYAASGVPVYWILDVNQNRLEIHSEPNGQGEKAGYARTSIIGQDDEVPLVLDGREIGRFCLREIMP